MRERWFRYKPSSNSSRKTADFSPIPSPTKSKPSTSKRKSVARVKTENIDGLESDSSIEIMDKPSVKKKPKRLSAPADEEETEPVEMSFCLYVETPAPPVLNVRRTNAKPPPKTTTLGPYEFPSSIDYADFLCILSEVCRTNTSNLNHASMEWVFDRPNNSKRKPLTNDTGFGVMIKALKNRHKDYVFSIYMSPRVPSRKSLCVIYLNNLRSS